MSAEIVTYSFQGFEGVPSSCQLSIYRRPDFDVVIIENSEVEEETLAIKRIEAIVTGATKLYQLDPARTAWITYTPEPLNLLGQFRKIPIEWTQKGFTLPKPGTPWTYLSQTAVEEMIGEPLR